MLIIYVGIVYLQTIMSKSKNSSKNVAIIGGGFGEYAIIIYQ